MLAGLAQLPLLAALLSLRAGFGSSSRRGRILKVEQVKIGPMKLTFGLILFAFVAGPFTSHGEKVYSLGMVSKSQGNPFFEAAHVGAKDAEPELAATHHLSINIHRRTPNEEDAQKQADMVAQLLLAGPDG